METQVLIACILALSANNLIHSTVEVQSAKKKVSRLDAYINKKPYKESNIKIDTRIKSYSISFVMFLLITSFFYTLFLFIDIPSKQSLMISIILLVISYAIEAVGFDSFHVEIEKVTNKFKDDPKEK